jgi:hypothetical protein
MPYPLPCGVPPRDISRAEHRLYIGLRGSRQRAGGVQRPPAGDNIVQADRSESAPSRVGIAEILLGGGSPRKPEARSCRVGEDSMGEYRRLALLVLIMIGVCVIVGATAIGMIYEEALDREREWLVNIAQARRD